MHALTENILKWLKQNQDELNKIDFALDVDLVKEMSLNVPEALHVEFVNFNVPRAHKETYTQNYNTSHVESQLFVPNQSVQFKTNQEKKWNNATVTKSHDGLSYSVGFPDGSCSRRKAKYIRSSSSSGPGAGARDVLEDVPGPKKVI